MTLSSSDTHPTHDSSQPADSVREPNQTTPSTETPTQAPATPLIAPITRPPANQPPRTRLQLDAETEQEIEAALADLGPAEILARSAPRPAAAKQDPKAPKDNRQRGRVISVSGGNILVDLGTKSEAVIPVAQFPEGVPDAGSEIEVLADHYDPDEGMLVLRRPGAAQEADWSTIQEGMIVEGRVTEANKGGLSVDLSGIRAFLPASQIDLVRVADMNSFVGQTLRCQVTEVKKSEKNVILSRRALLEAEREAAREKTWTELAEGQTRTGIVRTVKDFGAFVDLGGIDGLLPVREMSWTRVADPNELLRPGQQLQVQILKIDRDTRKITVGMRQLQESPWDTIEQRFPLGATVTGKVTRLMEFGAFVELEPGVEGLVHISELANTRVRRVGDIVKEGQELLVRVLKVDREQRRIGLSHKATIQKVEAPVEEEPESSEPPPPKTPRKTPLKGGLER